VLPVVPSCVNKVSINPIVQSKIPSVVINKNVQVKEDKMDRACGTNGGEEECI
jgi:hypothetical protein